MTPSQELAALTRVAMFLGVEPQRVRDAMDRVGVVFADDQKARVLQFGRVTDVRPCDVEG
jgi:hypothetical protein